MSVTVRKIKQYRALAEQHPGHRSAIIILELCAEIEELRSRTKSNGQITEDTMWPYGKHKGTPLHAVPLDYLRWWVSQLNVEHLKIDATLAQFPAKAVAQKKLRLHEYLTNEMV